MKSKITALPYVVWTLVFVLVPLVLIVVFAFSNAQGQFTINNFSYIINYIPVLTRSLVLAIIATTVCLVLAYPISFYISRQSRAVQQMFLVFIMLPMWMNFILRTYAWMTILENNGLINRFLMSMSMEPIKLINTQWAVLIGMVYNYLPFMILPIYSIMTKIKKDVIEASQDLGANSFVVVSKIIFPLSLPGVATGITTVFVSSVSTFVISRMLGGGSNLLIGDLIEMQFLGLNYNPHLGSAISLVLIVISLCAIAFIQQLDPEEIESMQL